MATQQLQQLIKELRQRIEDNHHSAEMQHWESYRFEYLDNFLQQPNRSDLEKAFFLILHQFPTDSKSYIVQPGEMVLIPDVYDMSCPGIEYEIDFAVYGGSIDNPVKVAVECDGIRSHAEKHSNKDRRKNVNLQAAGWIVMRFGSKEIHDELKKFQQVDNHVSGFLMSIENTISQKLRLIDAYTYAKDDYRSKLTGYKWGKVECTHCGHSQTDRLNHKTLTCRSCQSKFKRYIGMDEQIQYDMNGILYFRS